MGIVLCRHCSKEIPETVRVCPHCSALQQSLATRSTAIPDGVTGARMKKKMYSPAIDMDIPAHDGSKISALENKIYPFSFQGSGGTLFGIQIVNLLLIIVTLGIYYFWAKARVRIYTWSQVDFNGDRFAYHGTGKEVLIGWLKAAIVFGIPFYAFQNIPVIIGAPTPFIIAGVIISFLIISIFVPVATVGSRRYRLSRTSLRGIRFSFRGKWQKFAKIFFACMLWMLLTLGFYMPYFDMRRQTFLIENGHYGNEKFSFDGKGK
jgi:uncharacterized membrane protein YjgN (DUF898 family)